MDADPKNKQDHCELSNLNRRVSRIEASVIGNGRQGLKDRVLILEQKQKDNDRNKSNLLAVIGLVASVLMGVAAMVVAAMK